MDDDVGLHSAQPVFHRRIEFGGPPHAVACGKHRKTVQRSGRECAAALATPTGDDRTSSASAHAQTEAVHPGSAPVVRLEGPLALGHGVLLSCPACSCFASTPVGVVLLLAGAVPKRFHPGSQPYRRLSGDCSRVLTGFRWVKPGQILADHGRRKLACPNAPDGTCRGKQSAPTRPTAAIFAVTENDRKTTDPNATELLAAGRKTVSFSQCRFRQERWSRRSEDGGSTSCLDDPRVVSSTEIASCCQEASAH